MLVIALIYKLFYHLLIIFIHFDKKINRSGFGIYKIERMFYNIVKGGGTQENAFMGTTPYETLHQRIDMICQHKADGTIIPLKIRLQDEDGAYQEYKVKAYRDLSPHKANTFNLPDVGPVSKTIYPFDCKIECFGHLKTIRLFYNSYEHVWFMPQSDNRGSLSGPGQSMI